MQEGFPEASHGEKLRMGKQDLPEGLRDTDLLGHPRCPGGAGQASLPTAVGDVRDHGPGAVHRVHPGREEIPETPVPLRGEDPLLQTWALRGGHRYRSPRACLSD